MSMNPIIEALNNEQMKTDLPAFAPGDTVVIQVKVKEGTRASSGLRRCSDCEIESWFAFELYCAKNFARCWGRAYFPTALASHRFNPSEAPWGCSQSQALSSP